MKPQSLKFFQLKLIALFCLVSFTFGISPANATTNTAEEIGDWLQYLLPAAGFVGTYVADDPEGRKQWFKGVGGSVATTWTLKAIYGKMRPGNDSLTSFPSGHTTAAFAGAGFIDARYGHGWGSLAYAGAVFTGYSRVNADKHFADDVLAGMSVALFNTWGWVTPQHESVSLMPMAVDSGMGLMINVTDPRYVKKEKEKKGHLPPKFKYAASFGSVFLMRNLITAPASGGTTFNLADFDKRDDPMTSAEISLEWFPADRHTLGLWLWPFESRDTKFLTSPINFNGTTFASGTSIYSKFRHYKADLMYSYDLLPNSPWVIKPHVGASLQWTQVTLGDAGRETKVDDYVILPLIGISAGYRFNDNWIAEAAVTGMSLSSDEYLSSHAEVRYKFNRKWEIGVGAGYYYRDIDTGELKESAAHVPVYVNLSYTFY